MQLAALFKASTGAAETAPAETIVVVPDVTALIVVIPAPFWKTFNTVPTGNATEASVGILKVFADALSIDTTLFNPSASTTV
jgi:hypothetical protein